MQLGPKALRAGVRYTGSVRDRLIVLETIDGPTGPTRWKFDPIPDGRCKPTVDVHYTLPGGRELAKVIEPSSTPPSRTPSRRCTGRLRSARS